MLKFTWQWICLIRQHIQRSFLIPNYEYVFVWCPGLDIFPCYSQLLKCFYVLFSALPLLVHLFLASYLPYLFYVSIETIPQCNVFWFQYRKFHLFDLKKIYILELIFGQAVRSFLLRLSSSPWFQTLISDRNSGLCYKTILLNVISRNLELSRFIWFRDVYQTIIFLLKCVHSENSV